VSDKWVLAVGMLVPLLLVVFALPRVVGWITGPAPQATPEAASPAATPTMVTETRGVTVEATPKPTQPGSVVGKPTATALAVPAETAVVVPVAAAGTEQTGDAEPTQAVSTFYALVSNHQFDAAAQLWSPRMQAQYPPREYVAERFSQTQLIRLDQARLVSASTSRATVAVDLVELNAQAGTRRYVGTWQLVRGQDGWMLDEPNLQTVP
jgi:hypothetical protein